jgi:hypothetical protein
MLVLVRAARPQHRQRFRFLSEGVLETLTFAKFFANVPINYMIYYGLFIRVVILCTAPVD